MFEIFIAVPENNKKDEESRDLSTVGEPISMRALQSVHEEPEIETEGMQKKGATVGSPLHSTDFQSHADVPVVFVSPGVPDFSAFPRIQFKASPPTPSAPFLPLYPEVHGFASIPHQEFTVIENQPIFNDVSTKDNEYSETNDERDWLSFCLDKLFCI